MANDSPGETVVTVGTPVGPQGVGHVGDHGGRGEEDVDKAVNQDPDSKLHEKPGDQASNMLSAVKEPTSAPTSFHQKGNKVDERGGIRDVIPGISQDEIEQTTEKMAKFTAIGSSEQLGVESTNQESQLDRPAQVVEVSQGKEGVSASVVEPGYVIKHAESAQHDINMQDAPGSAHRGSDLPDLATEDVGLSLNSNSGVRATETESAKIQAPDEQINDQIHQTTANSNGLGDHVFVNLPNDIHAPSSDSQSLSPHPHLQPSPVHPDYQSPQTATNSVTPNPLIPAHCHIDAQYPANPLMPFPSVHMETPHPMPQAAMADAILGLTFPFTSMEPTLPPLPPQQEGRRIDAYVKLCFDDGNVYYIKNAAVVFGRAESSSRARALNRTRNQRVRGQKESTARGHQQKTCRFKKAKSVASSSASLNGPRTPNNSRRTSIAMTTHTGLISSYSESARSFFTDPFATAKPEGYPREATRTDEEALIHLPPTGEPARKNISRRHARLSFNAEKEAFELEVMGKNGAFVEEEWVECGSTWLLHKEGGHVKPSGEKAWRIQIGGVGFALIFPPRDPLENEKSGVAAAGKEGEEGMSLEFLDGSGREITTDFNEEEAEEEGAELNEKSVAEEDDEDDDEDDDEEDVDSDLEAEENAYALAPSAEDMSENDSLDGYEEDDEGRPPPVRGKSFINGYPAAFIEKDEEESEDEGDKEEDGEKAGDRSKLDDDSDELDEEREDAEGDNGEASSSSEDEDDGDDYISGPARKRKRPSPRRHKPIARKNIKILEALKRPKSSPGPEKRGRGRPKKTVATKAVSKKPMKGPLKKQPTEQQREREKQKQEKARRIQELREREFRDRQERLRKLREEEAEEARKRKELERRDFKAQKTAKKQAREELLRERELLKEKQLRDALRNKALQKSLNEADKGEKARQEAERQEKRLLERQERLMREAREKEAAAQVKRRAQEAVTESARKNTKIQLPTISSPEAAPGAALAPLQLPAASAPISATSDAPKRPPGRLPKRKPDGPDYYQPSESPAPSGYYEYSHFPMDPSLEQFDNPSQQRTSSLPSPHLSSMPGQYVPMKEPRQPKPPKEPKHKKEKPPPKRKRTPSPPINEADLPPEALLKPNASYLILIHEAISNSEKKMLSLPDIYRAIQRKYPYFKLRVTTTGWQSSVRHNLSQSSAFERVQREGKGWLWKITEGFNIEKEKKKKLLPPPPLSQIIHPQYGQMLPAPNGMAPVSWNGMHSQQPGVPFHNGVYMAPPRPPGGPVAAPGYPNQLQMVQGGSIQAQYPIQPAQYQQPQQHPTTPVPNAQPLPTPNNAPNANMSMQGAPPPAPASTPVGVAQSSAPRSAVPRAPIPPPPVSNATRIQMAQLASQRPQEQRLSQTPMPTQPPVTGTPPGKQVRIDKATLLAFKDIIDNAEKSQKEGGPQPMAGLNYNQLRMLIGFALDPTSPEHMKSQQLLAGALQLVQKGREQQVKPAQVQAIPAGKVPINSLSTQTVGPQQVTEIHHAVATQAHNTSQDTPMAQVQPPAVTLNTSIVKVNVPGPTPAPKSTLSAPTPAPTVTQTPPISMTMAPQPKTITTPLSAPQPQAQQQPDAKPATTPVPKATSQQLLNLLARLKAQKLAQQQAQGQVGQKAQGTTRINIGSSSSPVPQSKRSIDQISTATGSEVEKVTGDTMTETHVAKKVDGGEGKQIEIKSEHHSLSQASS